MEIMKQISEEEEKPFTSSLNICQEESFSGNGRTENPSLLPTTNHSISQLIRGYPIQRRRGRFSPGCSVLLPLCVTCDKLPSSMQKS
jgi:hypothetical protein